MVAYNKHVKIDKIPKGKQVELGGNPNQFYEKKPSWNFSSCDKEYWSLYSEDVKALFYPEILPRMSALEMQIWSEILIVAKKENHKIAPHELNKIAADRLSELKSEAESIYSLRITSTHRIYGHINNGVFNIIWIDLDHGNNDTCVCKSTLKHT